MLDVDAPRDARPGPRRAPPIHAFGADPAHLNTWVTHAPFVWVVTLLVPVALAGHLVVLRAVARKSPPP